MNIIHEFIKHQLFKDVCVEVEYVDQTKDGITIVGSWWNLGVNRSYRMPAKTSPQTFVIKKDEISDWLICTDESSHACLRNATWKPLQFDLLSK
jgi:hypothetical protein